MFACKVRHLRTHVAVLLTAVAATVASTGCTSGIVSHRSSLQKNAIPARKLPSRFAAPGHARMVPIDFTLLGAVRPPEHLVGPGDVLGILVQGVVDDLSSPLSVQYQGLDDLVESPAIGQPSTVSLAGELLLPLLGPVNVAGKSLGDAAEAIRAAYLEKQILKPGRDRVTVNLIRPRFCHVVVLREDTGPSSPSILRRETYVISRRGSGDAVQLPAYENDVLHALVATGGLPGEDGPSEIWILRGGRASEGERAALVQGLRDGRRPQELMGEEAASRIVRIPLRVCPGQELPFAPDDVILQDGDVVYLGRRDEEYFLAGGLLHGGKYPLPKDHDVDILEAISITSVAVNGPAGNNAAGNNFRTGPGNIVPPTRAVVVRQLPSGEQIKIHADLKIAMNDPRERVLIQPGDLVMLKYTPGELATNILLNIVQLNYVIPNR